MRKAYRSFADVMASPWADFRVAQKEPGTDRVLRSTRLEDSIYHDLRAGDEGLDELETSCTSKLKTFPALSRDVYQSFYSLAPRKNDEESLSATARRFNAHILDHMTGGEDYPTIKSICEGRELPAYEAANEFVEQISGELDGLLSDIGGDKGAMSTLEKLEAAKEQAETELSDLLERIKNAAERNETLEKAAVAAANTAESKSNQTAAVAKLMDAATAKNKEAIAAAIGKAAESAKEKAEEVQSILGAWGDDTGSMERTPVNMELLARARKSPALLDISKYLGRFREIFARGKKNGYAYGRGEKYSLELGNDLSRAITSELAMLAAHETIPLFLRKYQQRQIKQYQRREPVYKGMGDIIVCLDESGSTSGDAAAWGKAVALTLLDIAAENGRSFALIHFSGPGSIKTDLFRPGEYTAADKLTAAETFLGGGTDFAAPLNKAVALMLDDGFENADIVFITDGECALPDGCAEQLKKYQEERRFTVTGILLDKGCPGMDFSLKAFCQNIYRTSELLGDDIVRELVTTRV